jgi:hypothetical protein
MRVAFAATAIAVMVMLAYRPAIGGGYTWDDDMYVTKNPTLQNIAGLKQIWLEPAVSPQYYPLVFTTFWVERHLWGLNPLGYHVTNVFLHILNSILVWRLLEALMVPGALFAGAIFALHPMHVESVAWITERKDVLSSMF